MNFLHVCKEQSNFSNDLSDIVGSNKFVKLFRLSCFVDKVGNQISVKTLIHAIFYKQRFFSTQPQCCIIF